MEIKIVMIIEQMRNNIAEKESKIMKIGFIGLGHMGKHMALNIQKVEMN